jgi:hypothetical protein
MKEESSNGCFIEPMFVCVIHSKEVHLISDNYPVLFFIIIPTSSQLTYLFLGEVAALFSRNLAGYYTICV